MLRNLNSLQRIILGVILIIAGFTLIFAFVNARTAAADKIKVKDIVQIREALKVHYQVNGYYPTTSNGLPNNIVEYLSFWPIPPRTPGCNLQNVYRYEQRSAGEDYVLSFCLSQSVGDLNAGVNIVSGKDQ